MSGADIPFARRVAAWTIAAIGAVAVAGCRTPAPDAVPTVRNPRPLPDASASHLPRWRGFNLLEKLNRDWYGNLPFREEDFRLVSSLGFNFVRLPLDYRTWTPTNDWTRFDESVLREIDQAVAWGDRYKVHVCLNFHRAPGYTVSQPPEPASLWTDAEAQRVCALHWAEFARRYRGIPNSRLSFNLFNEPPDLEPAVYARAVGVMLRAIRQQDPDRLVIADGLCFGRAPCEDLIPLGVAQAGRGYAPMEISHYRAPWVAGADAMNPPVWPMPVGTSYLFGPAASRPASPLSILGPFRERTRLRLRIGTVSGKARLVVKADDRTVLDEAWVCDAVTGKWAAVTFATEWGTYQNTVGQDRWADIPAGTRQIECRNTEGDWMTLDAVGLQPAGGVERVLTLTGEWEGSNGPVRFEGRDALQPFRTARRRDRSWMKNEVFAPWRALRGRGAGVMVGEFGAYNETPHEVVLRWMEDGLSVWKESGMGWALWNLRGRFGILDSERRDVVYEDFEGHKLDRKMLELLQRY